MYSRAGRQAMKEQVKKLTNYGNRSIRYYNEAEDRHRLAPAGEVPQMIGEDIV